VFCSWFLALSFGHPLVSFLFDFFTFHNYRCDKSTAILVVTENSHEKHQFCPTFILLEGGRYNLNLAGLSCGQP
jgi:hypothetical protein